MTIASQIGHYNYIAHCYVADFQDRSHYALKGLERVAKEGGFITPASMEAIQMHTNALILRDLADELMKRRAALLDNQPRVLRAAE